MSIFNVAWFVPAEHAKIRLANNLTTRGSSLNFYNFLSTFDLDKQRSGHKHSHIIQILRTVTPIHAIARYPPHVFWQPSHRYLFTLASSKEALAYAIHDILSIPVVPWIPFDSYQPEPSNMPSHMPSSFASAAAGQAPNRDSRGSARGETRGSGDW